MTETIRDLMHANLFDVFNERAHRSNSQDVYR